MRARHVVALVLTGAALVVAGASCSLDLDESKIDASKDGGFGRTDTGTTDALVATETGAVPTLGVACTTDEGCPTTNGCLKGRCDLSRKACAYDVCRPSACNVSACDQAAKTCAAPAPYKYRAGQFSVGQNLTCLNCAAAVHPWLFVVTATGVVAFNVSNPTNPAPPQVPIVGLGFVPASMARSGSRVWLIGGATGAGPSRVPVAYIDVPSDPFVTRITAQSVLLTYNRPAEGVNAFPRANDSVLLYGPPPSYPSAFLEAPLAEPATATATPLAPVLNTSPVATSGTRLLMSSVVNQAAAFNLVENAGGPTPTNGPTVELADATPASVYRAFATSPDGAIFWSTGVHTGNLGFALTRAVRGYFLVKDATSPITNGPGIDIEVYGAGDNGIGPNGAAAGPVALLDGSMALVTTAAKENPAALSAVQFVKREPLAVVGEGDAKTPRRLLLPVPVGTLVAAPASNGIGFVVGNEQGKPGEPAGTATSATVYVFDPACAP